MMVWLELNYGHGGLKVFTPGGKFNLLRAKIINPQELFKE